MIGLGYYGTHTPAVIRRNVLENPAWYTAYTPYQPEISQGRLEALLNFQTMVTDLTGSPIANASLLDEAHRGRRGDDADAARRAAEHRSAVLVVDADALPQTMAVLQHPGRAARHPIVVSRPVRRCDSLPRRSGGQPPDGRSSASWLQYPAASGAVRDPAPLVDAAHDAGALVTVAADLLALTLLRPPGEVGADVAVGTTQRFGVPLGYGGPHAGLPGGPRRAWSGCCPAGWSGCPGTPTATRRTGSRCRPASSTSAGRRRPATSAPRRCCSP